MRSVAGASRSFWLTHATASAVAVSLQLAGVYAAIVTFGVPVTVAIYVVGGLVALVQHLSMRRGQ